MQVPNINRSQLMVIHPNVQYLAEEEFSDVRHSVIIPQFQSDELPNEPVRNRRKKPPRPVTSPFGFFRHEARMILLF